MLNLDGVKTVLREAIQEAMHDDAIWKAMDEAVQAFLDEERVCYLDFHADEEQALVSIGKGDACVSVPIEICVDAYEEFDLSEPMRIEQLKDVKEQIAGIDLFIERLQKAKAQLQKSLPEGVQT